MDDCSSIFEKMPVVDKPDGEMKGDSSRRPISGFAWSLATPMPADRTSHAIPMCPAFSR
jgi:hypothetical protein